jgi:hypothetical protein
VILAGLSLHPQQAILFNISVDQKNLQKILFVDVLLFKLRFAVKFYSLSFFDELFFREGNFIVGEVVEEIFDLEAHLTSVLSK